MNITQVKINRTPEGGRMKAIVSVTFDEQFAVHDIKIIDGPDRLFLAMPSRKMPDGSFRDIVHPINPSARAMLETRILDDFRSLEENSALGENSALEESAEPEESGAEPRE